MIDQNIKKGNFGPVTVWQYDESCEIRTNTKCYSVRGFSRDEIFESICNVINAEEGYHAEYRKDVAIYDESAYELTVTIE